MKRILILTLAMLLTSCACSNTKEEFTPYPGGKCCEEKPEA